MARILQIQLLGDFHLTYDGQVVLAVGTARLQALFAYLVLHRHSPQMRQHLAFLFWPETHEAQALTNLRNLLHKLRHALPESDQFFIADTQTVQWRPDAPFTLDVALCEAALDQAALNQAPPDQAVARAELEAAVKLYQGALLPSCYDEWILPERQHLQSRILDALRQLVTLLEEERDLRAAIHYAQRLLHIEPFDETTYCALMRLHAANGDRAGALHIYQRCVEMLQEEFAAHPSTATQELYQRILSAQTSPPSHAQKSPTRGPTQEPLPLIGRTDEWKTLLDGWYAASSGKPACLFLIGEAGIGKTRLAGELVAWAAQQGFPTATAHCYAAEGSLTYTPVIAWLRSPAIRKTLGALETLWRSELARLLPELMIEQPNLPPPTPITQGWQQQRFFEALARAMLQNKPLLLFLDDLQWADRETIEWLHYLSHFDPHARLLILATVRREEIGTDHAFNALLASLRREKLLTEVALGPLSAGETASLAMNLAGSPLSHAQAAHLHQTTEGNPLFVVETMQSEAQRIKRGEQETVLLNTLPSRVHTVIQSRLAQLSPPTRELANVAATIGRAFSYQVLVKAADPKTTDQKATDQPEETLVESLDELCQRNIIREHGTDGYDFTHDKLREVAYNSLSAARRRLLHRRIAQALVAIHQPALDAVSGQVAAHYELAGLTEEAVQYVERVAEVAQQVYANAEAIRAYRHALALLEGLPQEKQGNAPLLYERLAEILLLTSQVGESRIAYQRALSYIPATDRITQARFHRKIGNTWRDEYHYSQAQESYAQAKRVLGAPPLNEPPGAPENAQTQMWWQEWIHLLLEIDFVYYWLGAVQASDELHAELKAPVDHYGTLHQQAKFLQQSTMNEFRFRRGVVTPEMVSAAQKALRLYQAAEAHTSHLSAHFLVGFLLLWSGDAQGAREPLQATLTAAEQTGDLSLQARCLTYLAIAQRLCQRVDEVEQIATRSLALATIAHMPEYIGTAQANLAWVAWKSGDFVHARLLGHAALDAWGQLPIGHSSTLCQWTALCPLIAMAIDAGAIDAGTIDVGAIDAGAMAEAIDYVQQLLNPVQLRLPDALAQLYEQACVAWENGAPESVLPLLRQATALAQQLHYI